MGALVSPDGGDGEVLSVVAKHDVTNDGLGVTEGDAWLEGELEAVEAGAVESDSGAATKTALSKVKATVVDLELQKARQPTNIRRIVKQETELRDGIRRL